MRQEKLPDGYIMKIVSLGGDFDALIINYSSEEDDDDDDDDGDMFIIDE